MALAQWAPGFAKVALAQMSLGPSGIDPNGFWPNSRGVACVSGARGKK